MEPHETDCEDSQGDNGGDDEPSVEQHRIGNLPPFFESVANSLQAGELGQPDIETQSTYSDDSEYSLDYEYQGPRDPKYRPKDDPDSDASELSDGENGSGDPPSSGFDMWDEDPYSTNDYTWELNDMRLTSFIKARRRELTKIDSIAPWKGSSFWRKEKGWPKQMPFSCSTTNHDQSANALCLVLSDYGATETLYAVYRDRIIECGQPPCHSVCDSLFREPGISGRLVNSKFNGTLTWIDSDQDAMMQADPSMQAGSSMRSRNVNTQPGDPAACSTNPDRNTASSSSSSSSSSSNNNNNSNSNQRNPPSRSKFCETHLSVSLRSSLPPSYPQLHTNTASSKQRSSLISHFIPFTKFIKRADFPPIYPQDSYLALEFEPLCLAQKYGYMAIGGLEGEFELYCCMDQKRPRKIWGTKFKSRNNVQLMTNAIQIVRWKRVQHTSMDNSDEYDYMLISCMNEAGILVYKLPSHRACQSSQSKNYYTIKRRRSSSKRDASESSSSNTATSYHHPFVEMHSHLRFFDGMPINDAKISPDGKQLACVGDDNFVFLVDVQRDSISGDITFGTVTKLTVPLHQLKCSNGPAAETPYSSQYVTWSPSSRLFAHSSDTHSSVLVWRADTRQILYTIDAAGYTYAITFHPFFEGLLTFSNRYGYFHTVNLDEKIYIKQNGNEDLPMHSTEESWSDDSVQGAVHLRHEITMVSFRGERDRRLRILAKINGLQWSKDGRFLYVATKKRVLAYELSKLSGTIKSLFDISSEQIRQILEDEEELDSRCAEPSFVPAKRRSIGQELPRPNIREQSWFQKWASLPSHLQYRIVDQKNLASHW